MITETEHKKLGKFLKEAEIMFVAIHQKFNFKAKSVDKITKVERQLNYVKAILDREYVDLTKKVNNYIYYQSSLLNIPTLEERLKRKKDR